MLQKQHCRIKDRLVFLVFIGVSTALGSMLREWMPAIPEKMLSLLPAMTILAVLALNAVSIVLSLRVKKSEGRILQRLRPACRFCCRCKS